MLPKRRMRSAIALVVGAGAVALSVVGVAVGTTSRASGLATGSCSPGYVTANLSWGTKCLRAGEFCKVGNPEYHAYGFDCPPSGFLTDDGGSGGSPAQPTPSVLKPGVAQAIPISVGHTVLLQPRMKATGCIGGPEPDRRCSPGAYYSALTNAVICSPWFHTSLVRDVPQSEKFAAETEYGMPATYYGYTIEIDHIVPLELGGSNDIANLFPEPGSGKASYHAKDALENRLHDLVCAGAMSLRSAQFGIATDWEALYAKVFGRSPTE